MSVLTCGSVIVAMGLLSLLRSLDEAAEEDARHEIGQPGGVDLAGRVVPVVNPVHLAEEDERRGAAADVTLLGRRSLQYSSEKIDVAPLDRVHAPRRRLVRLHLHL